MRKQTPMEQMQTRKTDSWAVRHNSAVAHPTHNERPLRSLILTWLEYADCHAIRFETGIGEDGFLGPVWSRIGGEIRDLLNGDLGRMDGGTLDAAICNKLEAQGFDPNEL